MSKRVALRATRKRSGSASALGQPGLSALGSAIRAAIEPLEKRVMLSATATFVRTDTSTQGNWGAIYGQDGYDIFQGNVSLPSYAQVSAANAGGATWLSNTSGVRALQQAPWYDAGWDANRIAACDYSLNSGVGGSFSLNVNLTDGQSHEVGIYLLDFDQQGRAETVQVSDTQSGVVLDTQNVSNFTGGEYLVWNLSGNTTITLTNTSGGSPNAVASGLFFAPPAQNPGGPASGTFVGQDTTTGGSWQGVYGSDGYNLLAASNSMPSYAGLTAQGAAQYVWTSNTTDTRAPVDPSTGSRTAEVDYAGTSFGLNLNLNLGQGPHQVALYFLDYDLAGRSETVTVSDAYSGTVFDTRTLQSFTGGTYLTYDLSGDVRVTVTRDDGVNAVASGVFFDPVDNSTIPRGLQVTDATSSAVSLAWYPVNGASGYNIYRNGNYIGSNTMPAYTDSAVAASYAYTVTATTSGSESAASDAAGAQTLSNSVGVTTFWPDVAPASYTDEFVPLTAGTGASLGLQFTSDTTGYITAIQFYKTTWNTGMQRADLFDAAGDLLGSAAFGHAIHAVRAGLASWSCQLPRFGAPPGGWSGDRIPNIGKLRSNADT